MLKPTVTYMLILAFSLLVCAYVTQASFDGGNATPEDTIVIETPTEPVKPTPTPAVTPEETPEEIVISTPTNTKENYYKALEKQTLEESEPSDTSEQTIEEQVEETPSEPEPINVNAVVQADGTVFIGPEFAGRQVVITGA